MKTYVISLERARTRRDHMNGFLKEKSIQFDFVDAIDGLKDKYKNSKFHTSVIATFLSHKKVLEMVAESSDITLILEDDAYSNLDVNDEIDKILKTDLAWDIIFIGWQDCSKKTPKILNDDFVKPGEFLLSHSYIVSPLGAKRILRYLGEADTHIDMRLSDLVCKNNIIRGIFTKKQIFSQCGFKSQIPKNKKIISLI
jgi:GR25 family glycosyltransferase involved in LPS biosynthesis